MWGPFPWFERPRTARRWLGWGTYIAVLLVVLIVPYARRDGESWLTATGVAVRTLAIMTAATLVWVRMSRPQRRQK